MNIIEWLETNGFESLWWDTRGYKMNDVMSFHTKDGLWCNIRKLSDLVQPYWCYVVTVQKSEHSQYVEASMFARSLDGIA